MSSFQLAALHLSIPVRQGLQSPHSHTQEKVTINFPVEFFSLSFFLFKVTSFGVNILLRPKLMFRVFSFPLLGKDG